MANKEKDAQIVELNCSNCGKPITLKYGSYRRNKDGPHLCRACRGKAESERIKAIPDKEREEYLQKRRDKISAGWAKQTAEKKAEISKQRSEAWKSEERHEIQRQMLERRWSKTPPEERAALMQNFFKGRDKFWGDAKKVKEFADRARERWYSQSEEEQKRILAALTNGRLDFYENVTPEQLEEMRKKFSDSIKEYWKNLPKEEFDERVNNTKKGMKANISSNKNKNELNVMNDLDANGIKYERCYTSQKEHPDFYKIFCDNPYKENSRTVYQHDWDFIIHAFNQGILVDVDGSIHNPKTNQNKVTGKSNNEYNLGKYIAYKDSQRPYQTDGLPAFIIQVWDDKLTPDNLVINVTTGEKMRYEDFISYLRMESMNDEELLKLFKDLAKVI